MSPDELIVTAIGVFLGPILWTVWLVRVSRLQAVPGRPMAVALVGVALTACAVLLFAVLKFGASYDVVDAPQYLFMYTVVGLAWLRVCEMVFSFAGLSTRDDVIERGNEAARHALFGGLLAVTLCYGGGNIGNGPGWWVVIFSAALATVTLLVTWVLLGQVTTITDAVTIDRDPAAGVRLGAFLVSAGLVLGRAVAGDWVSAAATVADFVAILPFIVAILIFAVIVEWLARPTAARPRAPMFVWGILPAALYLAISVVTVMRLGWPA